MNKNKYFRRLLFTLSKILPIKKHLSDLENISESDLMEYGKMMVLPAFRKVAKDLPFYKKILTDRNIQPSKIRTIEDFYKLVPVLKKEDIFPVFKADEICMDGVVGDMTSAIVTSGTSGVFAYGILTKKDGEFQKRMVDEMFEYYFNAKTEPILIINALAMGVSFSSTYPVISTSVRSDIVLHLIKTFWSYYKRVVVITDPHFAKKIIEEGGLWQLRWPDLNVSFVVGGTGSSSSLQHYLLSCINDEKKLDQPKNTIQGTMGLTEIGLNIFSSPPELLSIRNIIQKDDSIREALFGKDVLACPELFYYYPTSHHIEIMNKDSQGFGDVVISNLDTQSKTPLMRYNTGDTGRLVDRARLIHLVDSGGHGLRLKLQLPIIAIGGRRSDAGIRGITPSLIREVLYRDRSIASEITGHFKILEREGTALIKVHAKPDAKDLQGMSLKIKDIIKSITSQTVEVECDSYKDFGYDVELNYEKKWKNL